MGLLARLDRFVHAARLDVLTPYGRRRRRNLRWLPLVVIAAIAIGYGLQAGAARGGLSWQTGVAGGFVFYAAFLAANVMPLFGPRMSPSDGRMLDEREALLRARAASLSGTAFTILVVTGCFYFAIASTFDAWVPQGPLEWACLGVGLQAYALVLPMLAASWMQPALDEEEAV